MSDHFQQLILRALCVIQEKLCDLTGSTSGSDCTDPVHASVCNWDEMELGIEAGLAPLGCVRDGQGNVTGKVFLCKTMDEETGAVTWQNFLVSLTGGAPTPYTGPFEDCVSLRQFLGNNIVSFTDGADVGLPTPPANANHAEVHFVGGTAWFTVGGTPLVNGRLTNEHSTVEVESADAITNFLARGDAGETGELRVTWYHVSPAATQNA